MNDLEYQRQIRVHVPDLYRELEMIEMRGERLSGQRHFIPELKAAARKIWARIAARNPRENHV